MLTCRDRDLHRKMPFVTFSHIGMTDIGLVTLKEVTFSNRFLDIRTSAKSLLKFSDMQLGDQFIVDVPVTGIQKLSCLGCITRYASRREKGFVQKKDETGQPAPLSGDGRFVLLSQAIYATPALEMQSSQKIRAGVCGAALVRCKISKSKDTTVEEILAKGEIGGLIPWTDL
jgi:hypothetical protein